MDSKVRSARTASDANVKTLRVAERRNGWIKLKPKAVPTISSDRSLNKLMENDTETTNSTSTVFVHRMKAKENLSSSKPYMDNKIQHISKYVIKSKECDNKRKDPIESLKEENASLKQKIFELEKNIIRKDEQMFDTTQCNKTIKDENGSLQYKKLRLKSSRIISEDVEENNQNEVNGSISTEISEENIKTKTTSFTPIYIVQENIKTRSNNPTSANFKQENMQTETTDLAQLCFLKKNQEIEANGSISIDLLQGSIKSESTNFIPLHFMEENSENEKPSNEEPSLREQCLLDKIGSLRHQVSELEQKLKDKDYLLQKFLNNEQMSLQFTIIPM